MRPRRPLSDAASRSPGSPSARPHRSVRASSSACADACASLWIDGELVHLEDVVLHDATKDIRAPTHELIMPATS